MATQIIVCKEFKSPSFSNGDHEEWNRRSNEITTLQEEHNLSSGIKDLFFELLQTGTAISSVETRIEVVKDILVELGYTIDRVSNFNGVTA